MTEKNNIFQILNIDDIKKILIGNNTSIIIFGISYAGSDDEKWLKKFLKIQSKSNKDFIFVFYSTQIKQDCDKSHLIKKNVESYPVMYYIYDKEILQEIETVTEDVAVTMLHELKSQLNNIKVEPEKKEHIAKK